MTTLPKIHENQAIQPWKNSSIFLNYMTDNRQTSPKNVKINNAELSFFISNRFISNQLSDGELLRNFQGSTPFP